MNRLVFKILMIILAAVSAATAFASEQTVNVLCYHKFLAPGAAATKDIYAMTTARFTEHMQFLKDNSYTVIPMKKYMEYLDGKTELPDKCVVLTIDDGYKSVYENAFPILKKYSYPAVFYLYTAFFPEGNSAVSVAQVREMAAAGIEIGCHSYDHPYLTRRKQEAKDKELNDEQYLAWLQKEIAPPKKQLEDMLGVPIDTFAYPYGLYSKVITPIVRKAGYKAAFSVVASYNTRSTPRYALKRTMVFNSTTKEKLKSILERKPILLSEFYPEDGDTLEDRQPELSAVLADDSGLNKATIKFKMDNEVLSGTTYDPAIKKAALKFEKDINRGIHVVSITASGTAGGQYEYAWLFVVGKPVVSQK